jgi:hypothetical protein
MSLQLLCRPVGLTPNPLEAGTMEQAGAPTSRVSPGGHTSTTTIVVSLIVAVLISGYPAGSIGGVILAGLATTVVLVRPDLRHQWRMRIVCAAGLLVPAISLTVWLL